jgi:hypothetical protein
MSSRVKNLWTILICAIVAVLLPITAYTIIRASLAKMITDDNASIVFTEFQTALDHGSTVRDPITAAAVANQAYREKTTGILVDGWGKPMHIYAEIHGTSCELNIQSAGPDGNFGDSDDVTNEKTFDLSPGKSPAGKRETEPPMHTDSHG